MSIDVHSAEARANREIEIADAFENNEEVPMALPTPSTGSASTMNLPFWNHLLAGGISGTVGAIITNPLEVIKTRFQSSTYRTTASTQMPQRRLFMAAFSNIQLTCGAIRSLYLEEGLLALWKGIGAMVVGVMPSRAIYFASYNQGKKTLSELYGAENSMVHLGAAFFAGIATATATNPIWLVKTRMQLQSSARNSTPLYRNSIHCVTSTVKNEGFLALYKGLSASYLGVAEGTIQWVIYEKLKKKLKEHKQANSTTNSGKMAEMVDYFALAASSKLVAALITYPHEVLRTRLRQAEDSKKYSGLIRSAQIIFREEGVAAFYSGMTAHLLRVVPNSAIMFFCYELLISHFNSNLASSNTPAKPQ